MTRFLWKIETKTEENIITKDYNKLNVSDLAH